ncbi:hypothetical protein [Methylotuvimicrobium buryatense]|uniref:Uncharacterized protein n=1 Tax=Methylotuvimicrobium buryatense TaxID=95641 RepID=A0A4P9UN57_METBY|nr:hypothetical protein [Methylotuvimicrobium buryatense]QCW82754.1 hypothetical protein EQU24_11260 [Methylotuvimicrobium buryatense]
MKTMPFKKLLPIAGLFGASLFSSVTTAIEVNNLDAFKAIFGRYAPSGDCKKQPQIIVDETGFTFEVNGKSENATNPEFAASYGGNFYEGISLWFFPYYDPNKERPLLLTFNAGEKQGVLSVDTEFNYSGGPKLEAKYQSLVDGSPYKTCQ